MRGAELQTVPGEKTGVGHCLCSQKSQGGGNGRRKTAQIQNTAAGGGLRRGRKQRWEGPREHSRAPEGERRQSKMLCTKFFKTSDT
jgi:hypothetical protein